MAKTFWKTALIVVGTCAGLALLHQGPSSILSESVRAASVPSLSGDVVPVEEEMHEFMEYVLEPPYKRLRTQLASDPGSKQAWKGIKSDALILAESQNLVLQRKPDENVNAWIQLSVATRDLGGKLYRAAQERDYSAARESYVAMLKKCNTCHDQFADGEHQLTP